MSEITTTSKITLPPDVAIQTFNEALNINDGNNTNAHAAENETALIRKRGRIKGYKQEQMNLRSGGHGGRLVPDNSPWSLTVIEGSGSDECESDGEYSLSDSSEDEVEEANMEEEITVFWIWMKIGYFPSAK